LHLLDTKPGGVSVCKRIHSTYRGVLLLDGLTTLEFDILPQ